MMDRLTYFLLPSTPDRQAFCPAAPYVYPTNSIEIKTFGTLSAVSYQVYLDKTGLIFLPIGEGPDGDQVL
jgi:hypothetical protein